ncbi:MAG: carbamate kinase, partial [Planctomycetota bacterium]
LGGNAFIKQGGCGSVEEQSWQAALVLKNIVKLIADGHKVIITHGNGFQVGNIITRSEKARGYAYEIPFYIADAQTQGEIGTILQQNLLNELHRSNINRRTVTIITHVLVDINDPAFSRPSKPIGNFYSYEEMIKLRKEGEVWVDDSRRGYRKVVASPQPIDIIEKHIIKELFEEGTIVIACGGGGIPLIRKNGNLIGIDCVIDKDLASSLLAQQVNIDRFVILTGVERVYLNFGKPTQRELDRVSSCLLKEYYRDNHFPAGSMGPKILSALQFLSKNPRGEVIITTFEKLYDAFYSNIGTHIFA